MKGKLIGDIPIAPSQFPLGAGILEGTGPLSTRAQRGAKKQLWCGPMACFLLSTDTDNGFLHRCHIALIILPILQLIWTTQNVAFGQGVHYYF